MIQVEENGNVKTIFRLIDGKPQFEGKIIKFHGGYEWENMIGKKGFTKTEHLAFVELGFRLRKRKNDSSTK